jgi:hypothetical protein
MKSRDIEKDEINRITEEAAIREKAFFTIMRQSGLTPQTIKQLRIRDLESNMPIPCKINLPQEISKAEIRKPPAFIGEEATRYIKQYLAYRKNIAPDSLIFTSHTSQKEINTKDVSRTFSRLAWQDDKNRNYQAIEVKTNRLKLLSLVKFYRKNAKPYINELKNSELVMDDDYCRNLYLEKALPFLEIEAPTKTEINQLIKHQKDLREQLEKIENKILPKESNEDWIEEHPEEIEWLEKQYEEHVKWEKDHPEEAKKIQEDLDRQAEEYDEYLTKHPEIEEHEQKMYIGHLEARVTELEKTITELKDLFKKGKEKRINKS